jgi:outer membrane protein TolC
MVQFSVPLQWGLHRSEVAAAKSAVAAAISRREARELEIANALADAWAEFSAAREVEAVIADDQLPQAELGFGAAAKGYEFGRVGITDVLIAEQQLWKSGLDLVAARLQQQARLAEIEALIGDDL